MQPETAHISEEQVLLPIHEANSALRKHYIDYYNHLTALLAKRKAFGRKFSFPLFINPFQQYFDAKVKLMIIGQETASWTHSKNVPYLREGYQHHDIVGQLLKLYTAVNHGSKSASPFWQFCRKLNARFNKSNCAFVYNNISKVDENRTTPKWDIMRALNTIDERGILLDELSILSPNVVVFTTGEKYDGLLKIIFKNIKIIPVDTYLYRLEHDALPYHTYRTEHPRTLLFKTDPKKIIDYISNEVKTKGCTYKPEVTT